MVTLYGIKNCDTVKKARQWLDTQAISYTFHDLRQQGIDRHLLNQWISQLGWETLLNKRGMTWRNLSAAQQQLHDEQTAIALMLEQPTIIKRPILYKNQIYHVGFSVEHYQQLFQTGK